jgi:polyphenol oxidase
MPYLRADWPLKNKVHAFTTLRPNGYSLGVYRGLNLGYRVGDDPLLVTQNVARVVAEMKLPYTPQWVKQVHGTHVVAASDVNPEVEADGVYSHSRRQICAVLTADCLPILIGHIEGLGIAALHGGWRSLQQGIIERGLQQLALPSQELCVWLGPAIGPKAYVVGADFREVFLENDKSLESAFYLDAEKQWHADLYTIARLQLQRLGVTQIYGGQYCTYSDPQQFYSARYSLHNTQHTGGRMATLIWIDEENA